MSSARGTLAGLLSDRGIEPSRLLALRITLDPADAHGDHASTEDLRRSGCLLAYARMQDGVPFGAEADVLCFVGEAAGCARLFAYQRFRARAPGIVPGDLVYDPELADLLHTFISRAQTPVFHDTSDLAGLDDQFGVMLVAWPEQSALLPADHAGLKLQPAALT
jgi:hypothetical protein